MTTNKRKIYIFCPANVTTGGPELLHQLSDYLTELKQESYIVYYKDTHIENAKIPEAYKKYNIKTTTKIEYNNNNYFIIPEVSIYLLRLIKNGTKIIWWLSVDNFYNSRICSKFSRYYFINKNVIKAIFFQFKEFVGDIVKHRLQNKIEPVSLVRLQKDKNIIHLYQSEYARKFLEQKKFTNLYPLKDYINDDYFNFKSDYVKNDIVIYNPKKGLSFTKKLIEADNSINWVPIQNMTRDEVKQIMLKAKLYIDFGNHPGMDRMPREAALCNCCIITGKQGSAKYYEDVSIDSKYKFEDKKRNIPQILKCIHKILSDYENINKDFENYRKIISNQKEDFHKNIKNFFLK